ncbi:MAG TPA: endonuclease/exonuclease/phosphatase family protein [Acidimicrobiia bacterium]|nr:endonuclease/exonuclease/phosphatase family protein [Acidimicrobiia bacterium]
MILLIIPAAVIAVASLASFAGRWVWWLDVLANFRAQYFVVLALLGGIVMLSRWRRTGMVILGVSLINLVFVAPLYFGSPGESDPRAPHLVVMSFNLFSSNESYNEVIEYIEAIDADLVFLHEASRPWEVALDAAALDYEIIRGRSDNLIFGTLVLARDEVQAVSHGFAEAQPRAVALDYQPDGWPVPVEVLSTHTLAPTTEERASLRDAQLAFAADWAAEQEGAFFVVGDLNATPWSWPFRNLVSKGGLRNSQIGFGLQPTFAATSFGFLRVPIDHLLHSDGLRVRERNLGPSLGSDHFALLVDLEYVPPSP